MSNFDTSEANQITAALKLAASPFGLCVPAHGILNAINVVALNPRAAEFAIAAASMGDGRGLNAEQVGALLVHADVLAHPEVEFLLDMRQRWVDQPPHLYGELIATIRNNPTPLQLTASLLTTAGHLVSIEADLAFGKQIKQFPEKGGPAAADRAFRAAVMELCNAPAMAESA